MSPREFLKQRAIWIGFVAVLVPLVIMLGLQYVWLVNLEKASSIARQATLKNYLEGVLKEIDNFYGRNADRSLFLPVSLFLQHRLDKAAWYFEKADVQGIKRFFVVDYSDPPRARLLFWNPAARAMVPAGDEPEARSVFFATAPFHMMAIKEAAHRALAFTVDEKDPENTMILWPVTDESYRVVGVAGMILDHDWFLESFLPRVVHRTLTDYFGDPEPKDLIVRVQDNEGGVVFATDMEPVRAGDLKRTFPWVFTSYNLILQSRSLTPQQWARTNFWMNLTLSMLLATAVLGGIVLALRTAARERKLSEMKSDFVSNVSHELRTPLASIRVFGEFLGLGRTTDPAKIREYGEYIESESRRLTQLIDNILDFSKIESGRKTYRFEVADLAEVVQEVLHTFEVRLRHTSYRLVRVGPNGVLPPVYIDPEAIAQAFHNLLDNAVKYSDGGTTIEVGLDEAEGAVVLWVRDHGVGISKKEQTKIFERFHRVGTGLVHDVRGSGLGLAIVRHVAEAHGGRVGVESEPGKGSRFSIFLPTAAAEDSGDDVRHAPGAKEARAT